MDIELTMLFGEAGSDIAWLENEGEDLDPNILQERPRRLDEDFTVFNPRLQHSGTVECLLFLFLPAVSAACSKTLKFLVVVVAVSNIRSCGRSSLRMAKAVRVLTCKKGGGVKAEKTLL